MRTGLNLKVKKMRGADTTPKMSHKQKMLIVAIGAALLFCVSLCVTNKGFYSPIDVIKDLKTWVHLSLAQRFNWPVFLYRADIIESLHGYYDVVSRFQISVITFVSGMLLALSGNIFQNVFRNPIAAPSMLGVATGVRIGIIFLVVTYGLAAYDLPLEKYKYCYVAALAMLAIVMIVAKLSSGRKKFSVFDLLIVAAIMSQLVNGVSSYYMYAMDNTSALIFREITNAVRVDVSAVSFIALGVVAFISIIPFFLMRFSFNAVSFDNNESHSMGINTGVIKVISLVLGSLMVTAGMLHCGMVGMISLIVPFISRSIFGAESRNLFWGNILIGGSLLLLCRDITVWIPFYYDGIPIGSIVEFVAVPVFVLILKSNRRIYE
jgi:iron complex transport system permease protein